jgi:hypothetical protein
MLRDVRLGLIGSQTIAVGQLAALANAFVLFLGCKLVSAHSAV